MGELFVFVDECHRTQTGKLHKTMKALLPGAVFIGFTGTPLLKKDRQTSLEVFGRYIHTYKFGEAVEANTYTALLRDVEPRPGKTRTETYEDDVKEKFVRQPANMRLLIVVDKLLTGFDAPSCTYVYIDKSMQDHGLFQAICRTNRLDGDDKPFGYIVDYKDLFKKVQGAIAVYTSELDASDGGASPEVLLEDRLKAGRRGLEEAREALALLCEPVEPPKSELEHIRYFCGNTELADDLAAHEPQRVALYKTVAALVRAYASIADRLPEAGYSTAQAKEVRGDVERGVGLREIIRRASGETLDLKAYEADMRHLIDAYIRADEARKISDFGEVGLVDLIVKSGIAAAVAGLPDGVRGNRDAVAEVITNNVRSRILREHLRDPAFYDRMSTLLAEVLADLRARRIDYEEFLKRMGRSRLGSARARQRTRPRPSNGTPACGPSTTRWRPRLPRQSRWRSQR